MPKHPAVFGFFEIPIKVSLHQFDHLLTHHPRTLPFLTIRISVVVLMVHIAIYPRTASLRCLRL